MVGGGAILFEMEFLFELSLGNGTSVAADVGLVMFLAVNQPTRQQTFRKPFLTLLTNSNIRPPLFGLAACTTNIFQITGGRRPRTYHCSTRVLYSKAFCMDWLCLQALQYSTGLYSTVQYSTSYWSRKPASWCESCAVLYCTVL